MTLWEKYSAKYCKNTVWFIEQIIVKRRVYPTVLLLVKSIHLIKVLHQSCDIDWYSNHLIYKDLPLTSIRI